MLLEENFNSSQKTIRMGVEITAHSAGATAWQKLCAKHKKPQQRRHAQRDLLVRFSINVIRGAIHEEAPVKIGSEMFAGFPNHPFGITRHNGAPLIKIRLLPFTGTAS